MTENGRIKRSRRQVLAEARQRAGVEAASLARGIPVEAANGCALTLGLVNAASVNTTITDSGGDTTFTAIAVTGGTALEGARRTAPGWQVRASPGGALPARRAARRQMRPRSTASSPAD